MKRLLSTPRRELVSGLLITTVWVVCYFAARLALRELQLDPGLRIAVALLPILPFAGFLWIVLAHLRNLDELQRRIHLEALAIAFPLAVLLLMTLGLLEQAIVLSPDDWSYRHVWVYLPVFYIIGVAIARRRYQ